MSEREVGKQGLFEMVLVLLIIGLIAGQLVRHLSKAIDDSWAVSMQAQAQVFTSIVSLVHWSWKLEGVNYIPATHFTASGVQVDGTSVYVNRYGWPTHTDARLSSGPLSPDGCLQVWVALLQNPGDARVAGAELSADGAIQVEVKDRHYCRYNLKTRSSALHYFDYNVLTGEVNVVNGLN